MNNLTESEEWALIRELEKKELPEDTIQARWKRLNEIGQLAKELGLKPVVEDKTEIYERWARIRDAYEKRLQRGKPSTE
jgi:hypothetical protein